MPPLSLCSSAKNVFITWAERKLMEIAGDADVKRSRGEMTRLQACDKNEIACVASVIKFVTS